MAFNKLTHLQNNIEAIRIALSIVSSNRQATAGEIQKLKLYSGLGGLGCILLPTENPQDIKRWTKSETHLFPYVQQLYNLIRENSTNEKEYKEYVESLQQSTLTAFYTPQPIAQTIVDTLYQSGIRPGRVLEPSAGSGLFIDAFRKYTTQPIDAYELDLITGLILRALHPTEKIHLKGFETFNPKDENSFDIACSNIPFGSYGVFDSQYSNKKNRVKYEAAKTIHTYFFLKAMDTLKDGGILSFITSRGFTNSPSHQLIRQSLMEKSDLLSAIRLPDNLFMENANVEVGTDLIVLQKNLFKKKLTEGEKKFITTRQLSAGLTINDYFRNFSNVIYTQAEAGTNPYGKPAVQFFHEGDMNTIAGHLQEQLARDLQQKLNIERYQSSSLNSREVENTGNEKKTVSIYDFLGISQAEKLKVEKKYLSDKKSLYQNDYQGTIEEFYLPGMLVDNKGQIGYLKSIEEPPHLFQPLEVNLVEQIKVRDYIALRDSYFKLYHQEKKTKQEAPALRKELNERYTYFIENHSDLSCKTNVPYILLDTFGREILSLEYFSDGKKQLSDIFERPISFHSKDLKQAAAGEALAASLNKFQVVNLDYMLSVSGLSEKKLIHDLTGRIYYNPFKKEFEASDHIISGDVITKADHIEKYIKEHPDDPYIENCHHTLDALRKARPLTIPFQDIDFNFGERWLPEEYYSRYLTKIFNLETTVALLPGLDQFFVDTKADKVNTLIKVKYGVKNKDGVLTDGRTLAEHALINTNPKIKKKALNEEGKKITVEDIEATRLAKTKIDGMREDFTAWINKLSSTEKEKIEDLYNRRFNCSVKARLDGTFQTFPDLQLRNLGIPRPYDSQYDAVWMLKTNDGGIIDQKVGGGKTLIMCLAAYEMKRLKLNNKPMIIGLKSNVHEIAETFLKAYPNAKVLFPNERDFEPENRKKLFNRIKTDNWDAVILTHDQFMKIPQSLEKEREIQQAELDSLDENLRVYEELSGKPASKRMLKGLQRRKKSLNNRLKAIQLKIKERKDDTIDFDQMGIDHLFVDESHIFKNMPYTTRHDNVAGLGNPRGSQRAMNLLVAVRTLQDKKDRDLCCTLLSGTTISNSLVELYLIFKLLRPRALAAQGITTFDAWAAVYAQKSMEQEISVTNEIKPKVRFRRFIKVPELAKFYNEITDYRSEKDLNLDKPVINTILKTLPQTPEQAEYLQKLVAFAETGDATYIDREELSEEEKKAKMLITTGLSNKMALDMRLIDSEKYTDHPGNKLSNCAAELAKYYYSSDEHKGTQLVFFDLGTYKNEKEREEGEKIAFNCFQELKRKLVEDYHLPPEEIRAIQEAKNQDDRTGILAQTKLGKIRILCGSCQTMGTGVNVQDRVVSMHVLTIPWKPSEIEQELGRGGRKGNWVAKKHFNNTVDCIIYAAEKTLDLYKFNLLQIKDFFIEQLKRGSLHVRVIDEGGISSDSDVNYGDMLALLTNDPDLIKKITIEKTITHLEIEKHTIQKNLRQTRQKYEEMVATKEKKEVQLENLLFDSNLFKERTGPSKEMNSVPLELHGYTSQTAYTHAEVLQKINNEVNTQGEYQEIGNLYGFPLFVQTKINNNTPQNHFYIQGKYKYSFNNGILSGDSQETEQYFIKALEKLPSLIHLYKEQIEELDKEIPVLKDIIESPWNKESELRKLKKELVEIEKKISTSQTNEKKREGIKL